MHPLLLLLVSALTLTGCQTNPPNTQGAGYGETYTPVIDMDGVNQVRYASDLSGCRMNVKKVDANAEAMGGMIAGILIGAAVGASFGGGRFVQDTAVAGGGAGLGRSANKAAVKQETIMANCMAGRGYRVLEGATVAMNVYAPSPYGAPNTTENSPLPAVQSTYPQPVAPQFVLSRASSETSKKIERGTEWPRVEALAKAEACHTEPVAQLSVKGPGFENYSVGCANGDTMMVRCEFGNCRALR